ncbi:VanZ family protein [Streptomyces sp. NPDC004788]
MWQLVLYVNPLSVALFVLGSAAVAVAFTRWVASAPVRRGRVAKRIFLACFALVLLATLMPTQSIGSGGTYISLTPGSGILGPGAEGMYPMERRMALATSVANAAMFVPLAIFWYAAKGRRAKAGIRVLAGLFSLSVLIELAQLLMDAGRVVDIDDVILNTLGALIGLLIVIGSARLSEGTARRARRAATAQVDRGAMTR